MCLGIPGEVIELHPEQPDLAKVNVSGVRRMINIGLLSDDPPAPGDWVDSWRAGRERPSFARMGAAAGSSRSSGTRNASHPRGQRDRISGPGHREVCDD